jgi:hypothetical protein
MTASGDRRPYGQMPSRVEGRGARIEQRTWCYAILRLFPVLQRSTLNLQLHEFGSRQNFRLGFEPVRKVTILRAAPALPNRVSAVENLLPWRATRRIQAGVTTSDGHLTTGIRIQDQRKWTRRIRRFHPRRSHAMHPITIFAVATTPAASGTNRITANLIIPQRSKARNASPA